MKLLNLPPEILTRIFSYPGIAEKMVLVSKTVRNFIMDPYVLRQIGNQPVTEDEVYWELEQYYLWCIRESEEFIREFSFAKFSDSDEPFIMYRLNISLEGDEYVFRRVDIFLKGMSIVSMDDNPKFLAMVNVNDYKKISDIIQQYLDEGYLLTELVPLYNIFTTRLWLNLNTPGYALRQVMRTIEDYFKRLEIIVDRYSWYKGVVKFLVHQLQLYFEKSGMISRFDDYLFDELSESRGIPCEPGEEEINKEEPESGQVVVTGERLYFNEDDYPNIIIKKMKVVLDDEDLPIIKEKMRGYLNYILRFLPRHLVRKRGYRDVKI